MFDWFKYQTRTMMFGLNKQNVLLELLILTENIIISAVLKGKEIEIFLVLGTYKTRREFGNFPLLLLNSITIHIL